MWKSLSFSGQLISAVKEEIIKAYYPGYFLTSVAGQIQTKQKKEINFDDSYMGKVFQTFPHTCIIHKNVMCIC